MVVDAGNKSKCICLAVPIDIIGLSGTRPIDQVVSGGPAVLREFGQLVKIRQVRHEITDASSREVVRRLISPEK
jgi:hypothetical protein